jgi:hypothetical protein
MSIAAINWVAKQRVGNSNAKALLFWLAFHHNAETGLCCPGIKTLQAEMEVGSVNTVRTAMRLLKKLGFITAQPELKNGAIYRTLYTLNLDRISAEAPAIGDRSSQVEPPSVNEGGAIDVGGSAGDPGEGQQMTRGGSNGGRGEGQQVTPNREIEQGINRERNREVMCAPSGNSSANAAVASAQAQTPYPEDFDQSLFDEARSMGSEPNVEITIEAPAPAPQKRKAAPRRKPATPCPFDADASIPDEYKAIAEKVGIGNPQQVFSAFVNHALSTDRRLTVWPAGFRTWCLNELRYHPLQTAKPKPLHQRTADDYNW